MAGLRLLSLGVRAVGQRPRLLLAAWLLHAVFAVLAAWPAFGVFSASLAHRPLASQAFLQGFSFDLLADWRAAYGGPLEAQFGVVLHLIVVYAAAWVLLEAALLPAYLEPFDAFQQGRLLRAAAKALPGVTVVALWSLPLWAVLGFLSTRAIAAARWLAAATESEVLPTLLVALTALVFLGAALLLRVLLNLWKCARVSGAGGFGQALAAFRSRPGAVLFLAAATLGLLPLYLAAAGGAALWALSTWRVLPAIGLEQVVIFGAVVFRLWSLACCTVLWRAAQPVLS